MGLDPADETGRTSGRTPARGEARARLAALRAQLAPPVDDRAPRPVLPLGLLGLPGQPLRGRPALRLADPLGHREPGGEGLAQQHQLGPGADRPGHLRGQPLNHQLVSAGATFAASVRTAASYRLHALATEPPKPGLERVEDAGASIAGEVWRLPAAGFAAFVAALPAPMAIGTVELDEERKATMVSNLLVVLAGDRSVQPVVNAGSLYQ